MTTYERHEETCHAIRNGQTVLSFTDGTMRAEIRVQLTAGDGPRVVVNGYNSNPDERMMADSVVIKGEALTALRDAILELPDEAFPELPPPPWEEGDQVVRISTAAMTIIYTRLGTPRWVRTAVRHGKEASERRGRTVSTIDVDDQGVDEMLKDHAEYLVVRRGGEYL
jgi:hypothetical protein